MCFSSGELCLVPGGETLAVRMAQSQSVQEDALRAGESIHAVQFVVVSHLQYYAARYDLRNVVLLDWYECSGTDLNPVAPSTRMISCLWAFCTLILVSSYTANLGENERGS